MAETTRKWRKSRAQRGYERGAAAVEYALLIALISMLSLTAVDRLGDQVSEQFDAASGAIEEIDEITDCATWQTEWTAHRAERQAHIDADEWSGATWRDRRIAWRAERDEFRSIEADLGC